jgi:hypothetical protein
LSSTFLLIPPPWRPAHLSREIRGVRIDAALLDVAQRRADRRSRDHSVEVFTSRLAKVDGSGALGVVERCVAVRAPAARAPRAVAAAHEQTILCRVRDEVP